MPIAHAARTVLAHADCRAYLISRFLVALGLQMISVVIGWQVWHLTHSTLYLGYVGLSSFLPGFLSALPAGQLADRVDRRRILITCATCFSLASGGLLTVALTPHPTVVLIFILAGVTGMTRSFFAPASQSLLPLLVPAEHFPGAVALSSATMQTAMIGGPALGGLIYTLGDQGWGNGAATVYAVGTTILVLATGFCVTLNTRLIAHNEAEPGLDGLLAGIRYVRSRPEILGAISLDLFAVLLGGCTALLPVFASEILHVGSIGLGVLRSAPGLGAAMMAVLLAMRPLERNIGPKLFIAVGTFGLATIVFGLSQWFWLSLAALLVLGAADMISVVIRQTLVQIRTPDAMRGRVSAISWVFIGASNELGEFESGLTAAWFGTIPAVIIGGLGTLAVATLWSRIFPALRRADHLSLEQPG